MKLTNSDSLCWYCGLDQVLDVIPECPAKKVLKYAYDMLGLSSVEARRVLYDAYDLANSLDTLLSGGTTAKLNLPARLDSGT
jgi:hypothetical protein